MPGEKGKYWFMNYWPMIKKQKLSDLVIWGVSAWAAWMDNRFQINKRITAQWSWSRYTKEVAALSISDFFLKGYFLWHTDDFYYHDLCHTQSAAKHEN